MPYGLPGAMKLDHNTPYQDDAGKPCVMPAGTLIQPLYPHADQDGYEGEWRVIAVTKMGKVECSLFPPGSMFPK